MLIDKRPESRRENMSLKVNIPTGSSGNTVHSKTGSASLAEKNGVKFLITAAHVTNPSSTANSKNNHAAASVENSKTGKKVELDSFTPVKNKSTGKTQDIAVNKLDDKELKALEAAGIDTNQTLKLPEVTNGANSELPKDLTTTSNFKGGKDQGISKHQVVAESENVKDQPVSIQNEPGQPSKEYDQSKQFGVNNLNGKLGPGSSGGGLENNGILYGVVSSQITRVTGGKPEDQTKVGNIRATRLDKEVQADIGNALSVAA